MTAKTQAPALGSEGWFTADPEPALLGQQCTTCSTYVFPKAGYGCPNPACLGTEFDEVRLSRFGTVWSYTDARYEPPSPHVTPGDEHVPFCIAAVELAAERLIVLGQVVPGVTVEDLSVGDEVELVVETLFSDDETDHQVWKWSPVDGEARR